jgi:hypothetical protein
LVVVLRPVLNSLLRRAAFRRSQLLDVPQPLQSFVQFESQFYRDFFGSFVLPKRTTLQNRAGESCGTITSVRKGNHVVVKFKFEPRRSGMEQFTRYRERRSSAKEGTSPSIE